MWKLLLIAFISIHMLGATAVMTFAEFIANRTDLDERNVYGVGPAFITDTMFGSVFKVS
jgi:hypothetical protein